MKTCDYYIELLSARLDGVLTDEEERELETHLAVCPACRALESQFTAIHTAFADLEEASAPEGFTQKVMDRIRVEDQKKKAVPLFRRPQFRALAGLAACAVLCAGVYQAGVLDRSRRAADDGTAETSAAGAGEDLQSYAGIAALEPDAVEDGFSEEEQGFVPAFGREAPRALTEEGADSDESQVFTTSVQSAMDEVDEAYSVIESRKATTGEAAEYEAAGQAVDAVLFLPQLPEGGEELLGVGVEWFVDEEDRPFCVVTGELMEELMALAEEQWQGQDLAGCATNRIEAEERCAVVLTGEQ